MNEAMTPEELLKAENAFIRLHNQGVSVEEIAGRLGLEEEMVQKWEKKLISTLAKLNLSKPSNLTATIQGVNEKGEYLYKNNIQLSFSGIQKLKFDLWNIISVQSEKPDIVEIIERAKEYLAFTEEYLIEFNYKFQESDEGGVKFTYQLSENRADLNQKVNELLDFYTEYFLKREHRHNKSITIENETKDHFSDYTKVLPYSIKTIIVENFQGIHSAQLNYLPVDTPWIFILGNNGYGKSTFLQSLVIGLFGIIDDDRSLAPNSRSRIGIEYKNRTENIINNLGGYIFQQLEHLACYGPSRLQIQSKMSQNEVAEKSTTTYGLFNPDGILLNIETKLIEWHLEKNPRLEQVKDLLKEVIPHLADIIVQKNKQDDYEVLYVERAEDDETTTFDPVPFNQLAAGFRSIIGLIGDLLIRFIRKQPHVKLLSELAGIVLIDELENHLHPKWQYQLPTLLSKVFPNIQFIAATHSVIPILGAPKNSAFLKLDRSKEKGITVERIDIDVANLLPNSILTSPIFDMDTIRPIANEDISQLRTEDTYGEVVANDAIDKQLRELDNDPSQYPALLQE